MNGEHGYSDDILLDAADHCDNPDKIVDKQSSDNASDHILLSELAKKLPTKKDKQADDTASPTSGKLAGAPAVASKIRMHCWDDLIGEMNHLPHF